MTPKERAEYVIRNGGNYGCDITTCDIEDQIAGVLEDVCAEIRLRADRWGGEYVPSQGYDAAGVLVVLSGLSRWVGQLANNKEQTRHD